MESSRSRPALLRGECPELKDVAGMLRAWLDKDGLASLPLDELRESWARHRAQVEGRQGLFDTLLDHAPRLAADVERLRGQHAAMDSNIQRLSALGDPSEHRDWIAQLADEIDAHCAHAVELVYQAFDQELGGG